MTLLLLISNLTYTHHMEKYFILNIHLTSVIEFFKILFLIFNISLKTLSLNGTGCFKLNLTKVQLTSIWNRLWTNIFYLDLIWTEYMDYILYLDRMYGLYPLNGPNVWTISSIWTRYMNKPLFGPDIWTNLFLYRMCGLTSIWTGCIN